MPRLEKMLGDWVSNDLMTHEQAKNILAHEEAKPSHSWVLYGFLILGAVVIGIGVISLVAANWKAIPDVTKLLIDFVLLLSFAGASYFAWKKKKPILRKFTS